MANDKEQEAQDVESKDAPTSRFSSEEQAQTSSQADGQVDDLLEQIRPALRKDFEEVAEKMWQSGKDKRIAQHDTRLDSLEDAITEYESLKESGRSSDEALREMSTKRELQELKDTVQNLASGGGDDGKQPAGTGNETYASREQAILEDYGIEKDDPRFVEFVRENLDTPSEQYLEKLDSQSLQWRNKDLAKPKPDSSTVAQTTKGAGATTGEYASMEADELGELLAEYQTHPTKYKEQRKEIKKVLEGKIKMK